MRLALYLRSLALCLAAGVFLVLRKLRFLNPIYPRGVREVLRFWTDRMLWVTFASGGRRIYVDEPCGYRDPESTAPRVAVSPEFALTDEQTRQFWERGFLGPFRALDEAEIPALREHIESLLARDSTTYGFRTTRDLHLDSPQLMRLITHPAVVERAAQLMGPDLLVWRSNVFEKRSGSPEITWHQGSTFLMEQMHKPALEPRDKETFFEIGVWMAIDEASHDNGCLQFVPGTFRDIGTIRLTGKKQFLAARFEGDYTIDPAAVVSVPCKPGEFILFSERVIHGSEPNTSGRNRMSYVYRYVQPDTLIYRDETRHRVLTMKRLFPLAGWRAVLARGQDTAGVNRVALPHEVHPEPAAADLVAHDPA
jgi:non-heme Fe2+,alpha-ketoglutarate-dependent halogenase